MSLTSRIALTGPEDPDPEDIFSSSLSIIFSDDVTNQHGVAEQSISYVSPHLPKPLRLDLAQPITEEDRYLFSHYLWNASLLMAELIERDSLPWPETETRTDTLGKGVDFDVRGLEIMELGAGTALPCMMAGLLGARRVTVTDYPADSIMGTLETNVARNIDADLAPSSSSYRQPEVLVKGHAWGDLSLSSGLEKYSYDRVLACDCLWMPEQHSNLHLSMSHLLRADESSRVWVIAGFHTGRQKMKGFFDPTALASVGLEIEDIWERECNGNERQWTTEGEEDDKKLRKRWLVVSSLKRTQAFLESSSRNDVP